MNLAAIDIGSNAIRLEIACVKKGKVKTVCKNRRAIRLGKDVFSKGSISEKKTDEVVKVVKEYKKLAKEFEVVELRATATSAVREAKNRDEFRAAIQSATGIELDIIDGLEEAALIHEAVSQAVDLQGKNAILMDVGGGSVELIAVEDEVVKDKATFKMGTVRSLLSKDLSSNEEVKDFIYSFYSAFAHFCFRNFSKIDLIVGTGGNLECLGRLRVQFFDKNRTTHIRKRELDKIARDMMIMDAEERADHFDLRRDRADVILPAVLTTRLLMKVCNLEDIEIPHVGLRDGIILMLAEQCR